MMQRKQSKNWQRPPIFTLALLLSVAAAPRTSAAPLLTRSLNAMALNSLTLNSLALNSLALNTTTIATFTMPGSVASGTAVRIDGSSAMTGINQALKQAFEQKFAGTTVTAAQSGADAALQGVLNGQVDLAAIARPLTADEKAKGLVEIPVARNKIAIIVGANNPFRGTLTLDQFAKIYRGEITDWSQVDPGAAGAIRPIDRPANSDTRQAFGRYPSFANGLQAGTSIAKVEQDSTQAIIDQLGNDGISYATAPQIANQPQARALSMYGTMPDDPRYPFSQPLMYVYKGPTPSPAVVAFLGFATAPENQQTVELAKAGDAATATAQAPADAGNPISSFLSAFTSKSTSNYPANPPAADTAPATAPVATAPAATAPVAIAPANNTQNAINPPTAPAAGTNPVANIAVNPGAGAPAATDGGTTTALVPAPAESAAPTSEGFPKWLWWLLPLGLGAVILGWLFKDRGSEEEWQTVAGVEDSFDRPGLAANPESNFDPSYDPDHDPNYSATLERDMRLDAEAESGRAFGSGVAETAAGAAQRVTNAAANTATGAIDAVSNAAETTTGVGKAALAGGAAAAAGAGAAMMGGLGALIGGARNNGDRNPADANATPATEADWSAADPDISATSARPEGHGFLGKIGDKVSKIVDGAKQKVSDVAIGVTDTAGNVVADDAGRGISQVAGGVAGAATDAADGAANVASRVGDTVANVAGDVAQGTGNVVSGVAGTVGNLSQGAGSALSNVTDTAGTAIQETAQGVNEFANNATNAVTDRVGNIFEQAPTNVFEQAANTAADTASNTANQFTSDAEAAISDEVIWFENNQS